MPFADALSRPLGGAPRSRLSLPMGAPDGNTGTDPVGAIRWFASHPGPKWRPCNGAPLGSPVSDGIRHVGPAMGAFALQTGSTNDPYYTYISGYSPFWDRWYKLGLDGNSTIGIAYSDDGKTWFNGMGSGMPHYKNFCFSPGQAIMFSGYNTNWRTSSKASAFQQQTDWSGPPSNQYAQAAVWSDALQLWVCAVGYAYSGAGAQPGGMGTFPANSSVITMRYSSNTGINMYDNMLDITFANGLYVAVGTRRDNGAAVYVGIILTSTDGINWTARYPTGLGVHLSRIVWTGKRWIAYGGGNGTTIYISDDTVTWSTASLPVFISSQTSQNAEPRPAMVCDDVVIIPRDSGNSGSLVSYDHGSTWSHLTTPDFGAYNHNLTTNGKIVSHTGPSGYVRWFVPRDSIILPAAKPTRDNRNRLATPYIKVAA